MKNVLGKLKGFIRSHKVDTAIVSGLVVVSGLVSGLNMANYPQRFEDEGTYIAQAQAVRQEGEMAHYTYWYDHPPAAWIQMAGYDLVTGASHRYGNAVAAGREFMLVLHLATVVLLYALARRLRLGYVAAGVATLLFALSPLVVEFSRLVLIDNVALPWVLGAFLLALSPRRHLVAVIGSALCLSVAILCKITFAVFLPALLLALYIAGDKRNRRFLFTAFGIILTLTTAMWALYALLKNEFFPGEDHVSLLGTLAWQLNGREGSGSILDTNSSSRGLVEYWLNIDAWLIVAGAVLTPLAFIRRQVRPLALAMLIGLAMLLRTGYLPYPYIIALLPLAALTIGNALQLVIVDPIRNTKAKKGWLTAVRRSLAAAAAVILLAGTILSLIPSWQPKLAAALTADPDAGSRQAVAWVATNVGRDNRLVVDSVYWQDLHDAGFTDPRLVWLYKTETDPEIVEELGGWQGIDYLVLQGPTLRDNSSEEFPTVFKAIENGEIVAEFGQDDHKVVVVKVNQQTEKSPVR